MKKQIASIVFAGAAVFLSTGCASTPSGQETTALRHKLTITKEIKKDNAYAGLYLGDVILRR